MLCSVIFLFLGFGAIIKGELKFSKTKRISGFIARILGGILILGGLVGGLLDLIANLGIIAYIITLVIVLGIGAFALLFYEDTSNIRGKIEDVYSSGSPYNPKVKNSPVQAGPAVNISSNGNNAAASQFSAFNLTPNTYTPEIYTPRSRADEVESDLFQTDIDSTLAQSSYSIPAAIPFETAAITGTLLSAATRVDTYPKHSDFNVYNIRSAFSRKPGQPAVCPHCAGGLKCESIKPSKGVRMDLNTTDLLANHRYSSLFTCAKCKWWCIRENWLSNQKSNYVCDFLIQGGIPINTSTSIIYNEVSYDRNPEPWNKALIFPDLYDEYTELPKYLVKIFPLK